MPDREKVISGLEHCRKYGTLCGLDCNGHYEYTDNLQDIIKVNNHRKDCPYGKCRTGCVVTLIDDALALLNLLKEQEAKPIAEHGRMFSIRYGSCPNCLKPIDSDVNPKACGHCGQKVKWE